MDVGDSITLEQALELALKISKQGLGKVEPNPCVGCVVIDEKNNKLISYGHHTKFGEAHAEVEALKNLDSKTNFKELTIIVTLEPCSHFGKTPPCAELVKSKGFKKLVYVDQDPNPKVAGRGLALLKEAGVEVVKAPEKYSKANHITNDKFFHSLNNKETFFHLKWAETKDGKTSLNGDSKWITNEESRAYSHFLRAQSDAVLVGRETLIRDNPSLNIRFKGYEKENKVIVFDPKLKSLNEVQNVNIAKVRDHKNIIFLCDEDHQEFSNFSFLKLKKNSGGEYCLKTLAKDLFEKFKLQSVFVEGGAKTLGAFLEQGVYQRVSVFKGQKVFGEEGVSPFDGLEVSSLEDLKALELFEQKEFGADEYFDYRVRL